MSKRKKIQKYFQKKAFQSPGTLEYVGKDVAKETSIRLVEYSDDFIEEKPVKLVSDCKLNHHSESVIWLDVDGLHEVEIIEAIGKHYGLHSLLLEDVLNTEQKPKLEHFPNKNLFVVLKMLRFHDDISETEIEHIALVLGENYLISFQEIQKTDIFQPVLTRLHTSIGKTRKNKADYLFYSLIDLVVDNYFVVLENFSEKLEEIEVKIIENPQSSDQTQLYKLRRELMSIKKVIQPLRDILGMLVREDSELIKSSTNIYLRDVYDHILQVLDSIETNREMIENIQNIYLTNISNKMNSVMKTLTVFTAIFMPLSFIAGIYGMNFENMPELKNANGYYFSLVGMAVVFISLWIYFKWKKYV